MILDENWSRGIIKKSGFFSSTKPLQDSHQTTPRKKIYISSCLARLGTNRIHHQTHLSAVRITTHWPPCLKLTEEPEKDQKEQQWCGFHQDNTTSLGWSRQKYLERPEHTDSLAADVPSLTTCCFSQKNLSQLPQGFGVWGHHAGMSRRITIV